MLQFVIKITEETVMKIFVDVLPGQGAHDRAGPGGAGNKWRYDVSAGRRELSVPSWLHRPLMSGTHGGHTVMLLNLLFIRLVLPSKLRTHSQKLKKKTSSGGASNQPHQTPRTVSNRTRLTVTTESGLSPAASTCQTSRC